MRKTNSTICHVYLRPRVISKTAPFAASSADDAHNQPIDVTDWEFVCYGANR